MEPMRSHSGCCAFMAILFTYSASVQLNDSDWYMWFPLYSIASVVNMMNAIQINRASCTHMVVMAFWWALALFVKVVTKACVWETKTSQWREFFSLDMERRVVREKLGSGLVVFSMLLHLKALKASRSHASQIRPASSQRVGSRIGFGDVLYVIEMPPTGGRHTIQASQSTIHIYFRKVYRTQLYISLGFDDRMILLALVSGGLCLAFFLPAKKI